VGAGGGVGGGGGVKNMLGAQRDTGQLQVERHVGSYVASVATAADMAIVSQPAIMQPRFPIATAAWWLL